MTVTWDSYLNDNVQLDRFTECRRRCQGAFAEQRDNIRRVFQALSPRVVTCLGAGVLNDIPYPEFIQCGATVHLVDWLPGATLMGIDLSIIDLSDPESPRCLYCNPDVSSQEFCRHFRPECDTQARVCESYVPSPDDPPRCLAFEKGSAPILHQADVTGGYAGEFGRRVMGELRTTRSWREAFKKGSTLARRLGSEHVPLDIPDHSCDLVTSSMLLSQFEHEPYEYFSHRVADRLGPPSPNEEAELLELMENLRGLLVEKQVECHCREIRRLLAPEGKCYMSFEMFHRLDDKGRWFVVTGMPRALEIVGRHFLINSEILADKDWMSGFQMADARSQTCALVLEAKN